MLQDLLKIFILKFEKCQERFSSLYSEVCGITNELNVEIRLLCLANKEINHANYPYENAEDYFRRSVYMPTFQNVIEDLKSHFPEETLNLYNLFVLFPDFLHNNKQSRANAVYDLSEKILLFFNMQKG